MSNNTVTIYALGGTGINIIQPLRSLKTAGSEGYADISYLMADTAKSNLVGDNSDFYHVENRNENTDGSGKERKVNLAACRAAVPVILDTLPPGDLSILVHSASGGSGSALGNVLASELLSRKKDVVVFLVGSQTCFKEVTNSLECLLSYKKIVDTKQRPLAVRYFDNSLTETKQLTNEQVHVAILIMALVWSGEHLGLDRKDLHNFLNYQNVTSYEPALVALEEYVKEGVKHEDGQPVSSVVTLVKEGESENPGEMVHYHAYGVITEENHSRHDILGTPVHLCTRQGRFGDIIAELEKLRMAGESSYKVKQINSLDGISGLDEDDLIS